MLRLWSVCGALTVWNRWKDLGNMYRTKWEVKAVPQLVRYQWVDGEIRATEKLVESEVNDDKKLLEFVSA